jgi:hypothetical protein
MSHSRAIVAFAFGVAAMGCGGAEPEPPLSTAEAPEAPNTPDEAEGAATQPGSGLELSIEGRVDWTTALARLDIQEGEPDVHFSITGGADPDWLQLSFTFDDVASSMGPHDVELSSALDGQHGANGHLDGQDFYSQSGHVSFTLLPEGRIDGRFDMVLARGVVSPATPAGTEATPLSGDFHGSWVLSCQSRLGGHQTLIAGGNYCDSLEF